MATGAAFTNRDQPYWRPAQRAATAGTLVALLAIAVLVEVITLLAQGFYRDELRAYGDPVYLDSLPQHVLAMVLLAGFAIGLATLAGLRGLGWLAVAVLLATAAGPMVVVAAPIRPGVLTEDFAVVGWWRAAVTLAVLAILSAATWWNVRCLRTAPAGERSEDQTQASAHTTQAPQAWTTLTPAALSLTSLSPASVFGVLAMAGAVGQLLVRYEPNGEEPSLLTIIAWAVLAAAGVTLTVQSTHPAIVAALLIGATLTLGAMYLAYFRPGGWPGVAGWEVGTAPVILSPAATAMLLAAPLLGLLSTTKRVRSAIASA